jgi:polyisoprenoid-binding protein YceI
MIWEGGLMLHCCSTQGVLALALLCAPLAPAQQNSAPQGKPSAAISDRNITIHFDPAATQIRFRVGSLLRDLRGTFQLKGGALAIDPNSTLAQGELLVDATTGKIANPVKDRQMHEDVLETKRYPAIFFHAEHLRGQVPKTDGSGDVIAEGMLNIHGADHPFQMKVHLERQGDTVTATTHFTVPYVEWGMKDPRGTFLHYAKTAEVDVTAKGTIRSVPVIHSGATSNDSDEEAPPKGSPPS